MAGIFSTIPGAVCQGLIWGILAIGVYITFKVLNVADLTVDGSVCTGAAVCSVMIAAGFSPFLALFCAFTAGIIAGGITGIIHVKLGIPAILSGILVQMILWSVNLKILGKANMSLSARTFHVLVTQIDTIQSLIILAIAMAAVIVSLTIFFSTEIGFALRSTGSNEQMSAAQGIHTGRMKIVGLALSNGFVALAGGFLCQYQGFTDINMGRGAVVIGLAAVVIGTALLSRRIKNTAVCLLAVCFGSVLYYIIYQVVIYAGFDTDLLKMLSALVVAVFLGVPYLKKKIGNRKGEKTC